jgi:hypothetical protein
MPLALAMTQVITSAVAADLLREHSPCPTAPVGRLRGDPQTVMSDHW